MPIIGFFIINPMTYVNGICDNPKNNIGRYLQNKFLSFFAGFLFLQRAQSINIDKDGVAQKYVQPGRGYY